MKGSIDDRSLDFNIYGPKVACATCENYIGNFKCKAFPEGIPKEILDGLNDHSNPVEGDQGILYLKKEVLFE